MERAATALRLGPHITRPSDEWQAGFLDHVRNTGLPETFADLDWSFPPATSPPHILKRFDVDRRKRPHGDMAPCAICSPLRPKCLRKLYLVWYQQEGVIRVIGPECGSQIEGGDLFRADVKAFELRERQRRAEATLEKMLPFVSARIAALEALRPATSEAERLHHKLRGDNSTIARKFRRLKQQHGGRLTVDVEIVPREAREDVEGDRPERIGPRGIGQSVQTFAEDFGLLTGEAMFTSSFSPVERLAGLIAVARALPRLESVEDTFEWMCENESVALFEQIMENLHKIDAGYKKLVAQLDSVLAFFTPDHFSRLDSWGQHRCGSFRLAATADNGVFTLQHDGRLARFKPDFHALHIRPTWPS